MSELSFREGVKLRRALSAAFSPSALAQVVYDQLHENLQLVAGDEEYGERLITLIVWAEIGSRTADLIRAARAGKPGDLELLEFEAEYKAHRQAAGSVAGLPPKILTPDLRHQLVAAVMLIPTSATYDGRSTYLQGLPASPGRNNDIQADLNTIFDQLDGLGQLASGQWPLLLVIDNILQYVQGYPAIRQVISDVRQTLKDGYDAP